LHPCRTGQPKIQYQKAPWQSSVWISERRRNRDNNLVASANAEKLLAAVLLLTHQIRLGEAKEVNTSVKRLMRQLELEVMGKLKRRPANIELSSQEI